MYFSSPKSDRQQDDDDEKEEEEEEEEEEVRGGFVLDSVVVFLCPDKRDREGKKLG